MATLSNGQIFRAAAEHIRRFGHNKYDAGGPGSPACLIGAVGFGSSGITGAEMDRAWKILDRRFGNRTTDWNRDASAEEAIAALESLAFDEDLKAAAQSPLPADETIPQSVRIPQLVEA